MKLKDIFQYCLAAVIVSGFFVLVYVVFLRELPPQNKDVAYLLVGAAIAVFTSVVNYFFSSTKSSEAKTDIISKMPPINETEKK